MTDGYWEEQAVTNTENSYERTSDPIISQPDGQGSGTAEYVHMQLPSGESVRFKREWGGCRFTDRDIARLIAGMEIRINTRYARGVIGSLEWQTYNGRDYYGFSAWDARAYMRHNAPMPLEWNGYTFTAEDEDILRRGDKLLLVCKSKSSGNDYAVNVVLDLVATPNGDKRWGINPLFDEFNQPAASFTRRDAPFRPMFSTYRLSRAEIETVRSGGRIPYKGISKAGRPYTCMLSLEIDSSPGYPPRWRLVPHFG